AVVRSRRKIAVEAALDVIALVAQPGPGPLLFDRLAQGERLNGIAKDDLIDAVAALEAEPQQQLQSRGQGLGAEVGHLVDAAAGKDDACLDEVRGGDGAGELAGVHGPAFLEPRLEV